MEITIHCTHMERAACPVCGSKNIVGLGKEHCHCGQCGQSMIVEIVEKIRDNEEAEQFTQMSLF